MRQKELTIAVVVSILLHLLIFLLLSRMSNMDFSDTKQALEVYLATPEEGWQIADIPPPANEEKPDKSRFLGMYDQKVPMETVRPETPIKPEVLKRETPKHETAKKETPKQEKQAKQMKGFTHETFALNSPSEAKKEKEKVTKAKDEDTNEVIKGSKPQPSARALEDFYPDYRYGEHTYLNVMRYPDIEYFVRLKRIFRTTWDPVSAVRREQVAMSVSRGEISVVMAVAVDKAGALSELFILRSSGMAAYDNEALRTVRASSPFAAPPSRFTEKEGVLRMSWTFTLYI